MGRQSVTANKSKNTPLGSSSQLITSLFQKGSVKRTWVKADAPRSLAGFVFRVWTEAIPMTLENTATIVGHLSDLNSPTDGSSLYLGFAKAAEARSWIEELFPPFTAEVVLYNPSQDSRWRAGTPVGSNTLKPKAFFRFIARPETSNNDVSTLLAEATARNPRTFGDRRDRSIWFLCNSVDQANLLRAGLRLWVKTPLQGFEMEARDISTLPGGTTTVEVNLQAGATREVHDNFCALNRNLFGGAFLTTETPQTLDSQGSRRTLLTFHTVGDALLYLAAWQGISFQDCPVVSIVKSSLPSLKRAGEEKASDPPSKKARLEKPADVEIIDLLSTDDEASSQPMPEVIYVSSDEEIDPPSGKPTNPSSKMDTDGSGPRFLKKVIKIGKGLAGSLKRESGSRGVTPEPVLDTMQDITMGSSSAAPTQPLGPSSIPNTPTPPNTVPTRPASGHQENKGTRPVNTSATKEKATKPAPETKAEKVGKESYDPGPIVDLRIPLSSLPPLPRPTQEEAANLRADIPIRIKGWFADRKCQVPEQSKIERTVQLLPDTGEFLLAFDDLKEGRVSSPISVIHALSNKYNPRHLDIGPTDAAIYIAATSTIKSRLDALAEAITGVKGERRAEIRRAIEAIAQELKVTGHSDDYVVRLLYAGTTCLLSDRSAFDAISLAHDGSGKDPRSPHMQAASVGGGATHRYHTAVVYWKRGVPWIRGHQHEVQPDGPGGDIHFPVITRVAVIGIKNTDADLRRTLESIVIGYSARRHLNVQLGAYPKRLVDSKLIASLQAEIDPEADDNLLFLADAPGIRDKSFPESRAGDLYCSLTEALAQRPATIHIEDFHNTPGHESNLRTVTQAEVLSMKQRLRNRPDQRVLVCLGSTVAWVFILRHLCTNPQDKPAENLPFFLPVVTTILDVRCIIILLPHPGVINYIGDLNWVIDAYCNAISMLLILGTQSSRVKSEFTSQGQRLPPNTATVILERCEAIKLYQDIHKDLQWPGMRFLWDGPSAMAVGRHRDAGCEWSDICWALVEEMKPQVIWSFKYPPATPEDRERNLICIPAARDNGKSGGDVVRSVAVPNLEIPGRFSRDQLHLPKQVRPDTPFFGYFRLDPTSLALQVISPSGEFLRTSGGNIMNISRGHWHVTKGYTPRALEAHARREGFWRELSVWDLREVKQRTKKKGEKGKVTKMNLVHTLDAKEIEKAVERGDSVLHPFQKSYHFDLWDEPTNSFVPVHLTEPWKVWSTSKRPDNVERVAPFVEKGTGRFGFRFYACSQDTNFRPVYIGNSPLVERIGGTKVTWIWKWAGDSHLAKKAKNAS